MTGAISLEDQWLPLCNGQPRRVMGNKAAFDLAMCGGNHSDLCLTQQLLAGITVATALATRLEQGHDLALHVRLAELQRLTVCHHLSFARSSVCLQAPPSELMLISAAAGNATLSHAQQLLEEEKDEVKHMNQMVQYAKCMSIRDKQIQVGRGSGRGGGYNTAALPTAAVLSCGPKTHGQQQHQHQRAAGAACERQSIQLEATRDSICCRCLLSADLRIHVIEELHDTINGLLQLLLTMLIWHTCTYTHM